jgi:hypothetical protein
MAHYLLLGGVVLLLVLAVINLALTIAEYRKKEGYFSGGNGGFSSSTNRGYNAFGTRENST